MAPLCFQRMALRPSRGYSGGRRVTSKDTIGWKSKQNAVQHEPRAPCSRCAVFHMNIPFIYSRINSVYHMYISINPYSFPCPLSQINIDHYKSMVAPDSMGHGANMGPTWGLQDPGRPHVGPMNLAIRVSFPLPSPTRPCQTVIQCCRAQHTLWLYHITQPQSN